MEFLPEVEVVVLVKDVPQYTALAPGWAVRVGVDLWGVLLAKWPARMLQKIRTPQDVAQGLVAGAMDWFEECVANCGSLNVLVISNVGAPKLREVFSTYLLGVVLVCAFLAE